MAEAQQFLTYKGNPLVRCGDVLYYGKLTDKYVIKLEVTGKQKVSDLDVADRVTIQLIDNNPNLRGKKKIVKSSERNGLYAALDIAEAWLARSN